MPSLGVASGGNVAMRSQPIALAVRGMWAKVCRSLGSAQRSMVISITIARAVATLIPSIQSLDCRLMLSDARRAAQLGALMMLGRVRDVKSQSQHFV